MKLAVRAVLLCFSLTSALASSPRADEDLSLIQASIEHLMNHLNENRSIFSEDPQRGKIIESLGTPIEKWKLKIREQQEITNASLDGWFASIKKKKRIELSYHVQLTETEADQYSFFYDVNDEKVEFDTWGISMLHFTPFELDE